MMGAMRASWCLRSSPGSWGSGGRRRRGPARGAMSGVRRGAGRVQRRPGRPWSGWAWVHRKGGPTCGGTGARRGMACRVGCHRGVWAGTCVGLLFGVQRAGVRRNTVGAHERGGAHERWAEGTSSGGGHMPRGRGMPGEVGACAWGIGSTLKRGWACWRGLGTSRGGRAAWNRVGGPAERAGHVWGGRGVSARVRRCGAGWGHVREQQRASGPGGACVTGSRWRGARLVWWPTEGHVSGMTGVMCCRRCSRRCGLGWPGGMASTGAVSREDGGVDRVRGGGCTWGTQRVAAGRLGGAGAHLGKGWGT